jgi:RNA-binding protein
MDIKQAKTSANKLQPTVRIGKAGITDTIIEEIKKQLKRKEVVKIKLLQTAKEYKTEARSIATQTESELIQQVGSIIVLYKQR